MAYVTLEQRDAITNLVRTYGPAFIKIEETNEPYGLVWARWGYGPRHIFVKPDGTRLTWELLEK